MPQVTVHITTVVLCLHLSKFALLPLGRAEISHMIDSVISYNIFVYINIHIVDVFLHVAASLP